MCESTHPKLNLTKKNNINMEEFIPRHIIYSPVPMEPHYYYDVIIICIGRTLTELDFRD